MSEKEVEIRDAEPVKSVRKELVRRSAKSEIILVELKSVVDKTSPINFLFFLVAGKKSL